MSFVRSLARAGLVLSFLGLGADSSFATCGTGEACPGYSTVPPILVGSASGTRIGSGFTVSVRDGNNHPVYGRTVYIDFTDTDIIPFDVQVYPTYNDCGNGLKRIMQILPYSGVVTFDAKISGFTNSSNVVVSCDNGFGVLIELATIKARSTDCVRTNGAGQTEATNLSDFAYFSNNYNNNPGAQETDFDLNGTTGLGDFVIFSAEYMRNPSGTLCTP